MKLPQPPMPYDETVVERVMVDYPPIVPDPKPPFYRRKSWYLTLLVIVLVSIFKTEWALAALFILPLFWLFVTGLSFGATIPSHWGADQ